MREQAGYMRKWVFRCSEDNEMQTVISKGHTNEQKFINRKVCYTFLQWGGGSRTWIGAESKNHFLVAARFLELLTDGKLEEKMGNMRSVKIWSQQRVSAAFLRISQDITRCRAGWMPLPGCREKSVLICGKRSWRH